MYLYSAAKRVLSKAQFPDSFAFTLFRGNAILGGDKWCTSWCRLRVLCFSKATFVPTLGHIYFWDFETGSFHLGDWDCWGEKSNLRGFNASCEHYLQRWFSRVFAWRGTLSQSGKMAGWLTWTWGSWGAWRFCHVALHLDSFAMWATVTVVSILSLRCPGVGKQPWLSGIYA